MILDTKRHFKPIDITHHVKEEVQNSGIKNGVCIITIPHVSAGLMIAENEEGFLYDLERLLNGLVPERKGYYLHDKIDGNGREQLQAVILGSCKMVHVIDGKLELGDWQSIFFVELDGDRENRRVNITVIKEG